MPARVASADRIAPRWTPRAHIIQTIRAIVAGSRGWDAPEDLTPAQQVRVERYLAQHGDWMCRLIAREIEQRPMRSIP